jgi:hypothetical protein
VLSKVLLNLLGPVEHDHGIMPVPINYAGPVSYCMARLHEVLGEVDEAAQLYDDAIRAATALGARPILARIQLDFAALLSRHGDSLRASQLVDDSLRVAVELSLGDVQARAESSKSGR